MQAKQGNSMTPNPFNRIEGTLIIAGLGSKGALDDLLARLGGLPARVLLIEPAATAGGEQARILGDLPGIEIVDAVPGGRDAPVDLDRYNLPGLRSLRPPTDALHALYPGLKLRGRVATQMVALAGLVGDGADLPAPLRLYVDLPGSEGDILQALSDCGALDAVSALSMRCAGEEMFRGGWRCDALRSWLEDRQFRAEPAAEDADDPDWPGLRMTADPAARRLAALEAEAATLREKLAREAADAADLKERLTQRNARVKTLEGVAATAKKALDDAQAAATQETATLRAEADALRAEAEAQKERAQALEQLLEKRNRRVNEIEDAQLAAEKGHIEARQRAEAEAEALRAQVAEERSKAEEVTGRLGPLEAQVEDLRAALSRADAALEEARQRAEAEAEALRAQVSEESAKVAELEEGVSRRKVRIDTLEKALAQAEAAQATRAADQKAELETARKEREKAVVDLGLAMRMQAMVQSDLDALRTRFQQSEATRTEQEALLRKLTPRLQQAAEQLRALHLTTDPGEAPAQVARHADAAEAAAPVESAPTATTPKATTPKATTPKAPRKPRPRTTPARKPRAARKTARDD